MTAVLSTVATARCAVARRRDARRAQRTLARELASYSTPRERHELDAILSRHTAEQIATVERALSNLPKTR